MFDWLRNMFPYTNFHELNADWIIATFREYVERIETALGGIGGYDSRLDAVEADNTRQDSEISGLDSRVTAAEATNATQATQISAVEASMDYKIVYTKSGDNYTCNKTFTEIWGQLLGGKTVTAAVNALNTISDPTLGDIIIGGHITTGIPMGLYHDGSTIPGTPQPYPEGILGTFTARDYGGAFNNYRITHGPNDAISITVIT